MTRIHVAMSEDEVKALDSLREEFEKREGFRVSRQKFARSFFVKWLNEQQEEK